MCRSPVLFLKTSTAAARSSHRWWLNLCPQPNSQTHSRRGWLGTAATWAWWSDRLGAAEILSVRCNAPPLQACCHPSLATFFSFSIPHLLLPCPSSHPPLACGRCPAFHNCSAVQSLPIGCAQIIASSATGRQRVRCNRCRHLQKNLPMCTLAATRCSSPLLAARPVCLRRGRCWHSHLTVHTMRLNTPTMYDLQIIQSADQSPLCHPPPLLPPRTKKVSSPCCGAVAAAAYKLRVVENTMATNLVSHRPTARMSANLHSFIGSLLTPTHGTRQPLASQHPPHMSTTSHLRSCRLAVAAASCRSLMLANQQESERAWHWHSSNHAARLARVPVSPAGRCSCEILLPSHSNQAASQSSELLCYPGAGQR